MQCLILIGVYNELFFLFRLPGILEGCSSFGGLPSSLAPAFSRSWMMVVRVFLIMIEVFAYGRINTAATDRSLLSSV
jgi:hypothetical protein